MQNNIVKIGLISKNPKNIDLLFNEYTNGIDAEITGSGICVKNPHAEVELLRKAYIDEQKILSGKGSPFSAYNVNEDLLVIVDLKNFKNEMILPLRLIEYGYKVIIALTNSSSKNIDKYANSLKRNLGVQVIELSKKGIEGLLPAKENSNKVIESVLGFLPQTISNYLSEIGAILGSFKPALQIAEYNVAPTNIRQSSLKQAYALRGQLDEESDGEVDLLLIDARYQLINSLIPESFTNPQQNKLHKLIEAIFLNKTFGIPIFFSIMYLVFWLTLTGGEFISGAFNTLWNSLTYNILSNHLVASSNFGFVFFKATLKSCQLVAEFVPIIFIFYLLISFLEECGYIKRITYVLDGVLKKFGVTGKVLPNLIIGFACNIPGIIGMKSINNEKERIISTMMMPFISCTARLSVFIFFCSYLLPKGAYNIIFFLYTIGIFCGLLTAFILTKLLRVKREGCFIFEIEHFKIPSLNYIFRKSVKQSFGFLKGTGKTIFTVFLLIQLICSIPWVNDLSNFKNISHYIMPVFEPMGLKPENWVAVLGLFAGMLAKESLVATVSSLYLVADGGFMYNDYFYGFHGVVAYLLFVLLYFPCISVFFSIREQLGVKWALFSAIWSTTLAYFVAVSFFQITNVIISGNLLIDTNLLIVSSILLTAFYFVGKAILKEGQ